jgi:hypothetical protein
MPPFIESKNNGKHLKTNDSSTFRTNQGLENNLKSIFSKKLLYLAKIRRSVDVSPKGPLRDIQ